MTFASAASAADSAVQSRSQTLFFEQRLARNPDDVDLLNRLSALYLQRLRESGAFSDLELAVRTARRSRAVVPAVRNVPGLTSRAVAEFASHEFLAARDDARSLARLDGSGTPFALLGDAEAELGNYSASEAAYARLRRIIGATDENVATRQARVAALHGDSAAAAQGYALALALERQRSAPSPERIAWYSWQLGDAAFFTGDIATARTRYGDALTISPGYFRALASLGRLDAARGDYAAAEDSYAAAIRSLPDPTFIAELGDVYALAGDKKSAEREYALVELIGRLSRINGIMYNRQLAMFYADHDLNATEAYGKAKREYAVRRDIYGADAVAWTAFKAGDIAEARASILVALRFGTTDPRLFYHAGLIAAAVGDRASARDYLRRALALNPAFDPLQAPNARRALEALTSPS
ncbi:MAG: hypothetical protein GIW95_04220 [Candidatus Eremiobacteraeota bacterium]|nr:hypothetical protein [Candidatus Eremiobacteraeota bacterium]